MSDYIPVNFDETDELYIRCIGYEDYPELAHWGPGYRNYGILHYVVKGTGYYNDHTVSAGHGFFIAPNQLHEYHSDASDPWHYFWVIFSDKMAEKYVLPVLRPDANGIFTFDYHGKLEKSFEGIFDRYRNLSHTRALGFFFRLLSLQEAVEPSDMSLPAQHVEKAKLYIENNFNKGISVRNVADNVHINERYLYNLFIQYERTSPKEYIDSQRYQLACDLLLHTRLSISEIACSAGFADVCTFSKFFSKKSGQSPTAYREG